MEASRIARDSNKERNDAGATESARELYALPLMARNKGQKRKNGNKKREGGKKGKIRRAATERGGTYSRKWRGSGLSRN